MGCGVQRLFYCNADGGRPHIADADGSDPGDPAAVAECTAVHGGGHTHVAAADASDPDDPAVVTDRTAVLRDDFVPATDNGDPVVVPVMTEWVFRIRFASRAIRRYMQRRNCGGDYVSFGPSLPLP